MKEFQFAEIYHGTGTMGAVFSKHGGVCTFAVDDSDREDAKRFYRSTSGSPQPKQGYDSLEKASWYAGEQAGGVDAVLASPPKELGITARRGFVNNLSRFVSRAGEIKPVQQILIEDSAEAKGSPEERILKDELSRLGFKCQSTVIDSGNYSSVSQRRSYFWGTRFEQGTGPGIVINMERDLPHQNGSIHEGERVKVGDALGTYAFKRRILDSDIRRMQKMPLGEHAVLPHAVAKHPESKGKKILVLDEKIQEGRVITTAEFAKMKGLDAALFDSYEEDEGFELVRQSSSAAVLDMLAETIVPYFRQ